ncbi:inositol-pentakisphosphate 2-kinase [Dichomitus squalens]|uniref:Inositol-pentakisphosphate 2-kinase n=1 Tax=Dichomitus squalens TaxID=114155 RepID=A0A4Q9QCJ9_9APHY|nr:inositol-pentakisphosphate 2-kinase [Dichomitus squalens]
MADTPQIADTSPHDWKYISEGGSTIVFSYTGPLHPQFDGTALRLRKGPVSGREHTDTEQYQQPQLAETHDQGEEPDDPTIVFQSAVIERLVPRQFLPRLDAVRVERAWLQQLAHLTEAQRPKERRAKDRIDTGRRKAVLATDLVGGDGWAVEIKPKWGFLPARTHLSDETREIKTRTCRFCMHAHLKSTQGEDVSLGYCPLDLFARDKARVTRALHALWSVWLGSGAAVNNLRVFVQGRKLTPAADVPSLAPLAAQLFPEASHEGGPAHTPDEVRDALTSALLPLLLDTPVLRTLSTLQRTLDALDVEGLTALWARLRPADAAELGEGEADPDVAEWTRFVDTYLSRHPPRPESASASEAQTQTRTRAGPPAEADEDELRYQLQAYLLSASFKDCSVILRMKPGQAVGQGTITVIDLDVKGIDRLAKWAKLDREIVDAYRGIPPRDCVDAWAISA